MATHKIICGHILDVLNNLPDEHVDMLMTSVPYWGLRDYGEDTATIWGGVDKNCEHEWQQHYQPRKGGKNLPENPPNVRANIVIQSSSLRNEDINTQFCSKCGAWHGQLGLEPTPELYIEHLRMVFAEVKRLLKKIGTCWVNIGDTYASGKSRYNSSPHTLSGKGRDEPMSWNKPDLYKQGYQDKCMCMIPERFAFMMIDLGYILRNKIIWHKPNPMPSSVKDRFNTTYEMLYFFSKSRKYWFDLDVVRENHKPESLNRVKGNWNGHREPMSSYQGMDIKRMCNPSGKNPGDFWSIKTQPFPEAHFAVFPEKLCEKPILAGCPAEVCKHCGKARERILGNGEKITSGGFGSKTADHIGLSASSGIRSKTWNVYETIGWTNCQCECENKYEPGVIIDPFGGSGTVGVVAEKLGRSSILIDIKKDYCEMAFKRLKTLVEQTKLTGEQPTIEKEGWE